MWRLWDEAQNEIADVDGNGNIQEFRYFIPGLMDGIIGFTRGSQTYFPLTDPAGNVALVVDESGVLVARYAFEPFRLRSDASFDSINNTFRFASRREEPSGEVFVRARSLEVATGRFLQRDPFFLGNRIDPVSWQGFIYARNSPLVYKDPTGNVCNAWWTYGPTPIGQWTLDPVNPQYFFDITTLGQPKGALGGLNTVVQKITGSSIPNVGGYWTATGNAYTVETRKTMKTFVCYSLGHSYSTTTFPEEKRRKVVPNSTETVRSSVASGPFTDLTGNVYTIFFQYPP